MRCIQNYDDFLTELLDCGFTLAGGSDKGVFSLLPWAWDEQPPYPTPVKWHTDDPVTDPWQWRIRVLTQRDDIAYAKVFCRVAGYITRRWYPFFLAVRRQGRSFDDFYQDGLMSQAAKRIYTLVAQNGPMALHAIKEQGGFTRDEKSAFDRSIVDLQMAMFLTICGQTQKTDRFGKPYGWNSTVLCTTEQFFDEAVFLQAQRLSAIEAREAICGQIHKLNPNATPKAIERFLNR